MRNTYIALSFCILCLLVGCETFRVHYGSTHRTLDAQEDIFRLDLSNASLTVLPPQLADNTNIRMINISGNTELDISVALRTICSLPNVTILHLNNLHLATLPKTILRCKALKQLSLANNPGLLNSDTLTTIKALDLTFLDLSSNEIETLPDGLSVLNLRDLKLSNNSISDASSFIVLSKMTNLFSIWLDYNHIEMLPDQIGLLRQIGYLYLDNNSLNALPEAMRNMTRLGGVWLGHNCFSEIPPVLADSGVIMAFLNNNNIQQIGDRFKRRELVLRGLIIDHNYLDESSQDDLAELLSDAFIYSDKNQKSLVESNKCLFNQ